MRSTSKYTAALVQMACSPDPEANLDRALGFIKDAARAGAKLV